MEKAFLAGAAFCQKANTFIISEGADIVITSSGYPLDINFYQAVKAIFAAEPFVKAGGTIIHLAECTAGFGTELFYKWMTSASSPSSIIEKIRKEGYRADIDHCYLLAKILRKNEIIVDSPQEQVHRLKKSFIKTTNSPVDAINSALRKHGNNAKIVILPYAHRLITSK